MGDTDASTDTTDATAETSETGDSKDTSNTGDLAALKKALEKERASRREADRRVKELTPFEKQAKEAADAAKSETQRLTEALEGEKRTRTSAETELLRYRTAADKGVPLNLVRFLTGNTAEEITESAELLLKEIGTKPSLPGRPKEERRLASGKPSDAEGSDDPLELIKQARAQRI